MVESSNQKCAVKQYVRSIKRAGLPNPEVQEIEMSGETSWALVWHRSPKIELLSGRGGRKKEI